MQPYLFPYIGYFQLVGAVDRFVFYDDVNYIRQGWINRNQLLINGKARMFSVPLRKASSFVAINQTQIDRQKYALWLQKFLKTIEFNYKKAPYFAPVYALVEGVFGTGATMISDLAVKSVRSVCSYLGLQTRFVMTSGNYSNASLTGKDRLIDICRQEGADVYLNPSGGMSLYRKADFSEQGILLKFLKPEEVTYRQLQEEFVPWLSMIDVLMFNSVEESSRLLNSYELL